MAKESKTYSIAAEPRELLAKRTLQLRRQGIVPGVVYGHGVKTQNVQVSRKDFDQAYLRAGSHSLVDLSIGEGKPHKVFIHDVQRDPINYRLTHIDFVAVNLREEMTVTIPIVLVGESPIVRNNEGLLLHALEHVSIRTLPDNIPSVLEADISGLTEVDQAIYVSDLVLPENVTLLSSPDDMVAKLTAMPVVEEEVVEAEETEGETAEGAEGEGEESSTSEESTEESES